MVETTIADRPVDYDKPLSPELEAQIDAAYEAAKHAEPGPAVVKVEYLPDVRAVSVHVNTGQRILIPVEDMQHVSSAAPEQLQATEIIGSGYGIGFPVLDVFFSLAGLMAGRYGNRKWMEQLEAKRAAALKAAA
jgi:hypothetical protein